MAVYSYMAVYDYTKEKVIFSYLDPDKRRLVLQDGRHFPATHDLRDDVLLNIQTVLKLHDMKIINPGNEKPLYERVMNKNQFDEFIKMAVEKYYQNDRSYKNCVNDICNFMRRKDVKPKWRKPQKVQEIINKANQQSLFLPLIQLNSSLFSQYLSGGCYNKFYDFCEFITGKWLEDFVLVTLQKLKQKGNIDSLLKNSDVYYLYPTCFLV